VQPSQLLAGPIIKRLTSTEVSIWLASTSRPDNDSLIILKNGAPKPCKNELEILELSKGLYISLFTAQFQEASEGVFTYKISLGGIDCLQEFDLELRNNEATPSFVINHKMYRFAHASCRKPHGEGEDAISALKKELSKKPIDALFLTGDQIYADDVDRTMFDYIEIARKKLQLPVESFANLEEIPKVSRRELLKGKAGFTSEASDCHLMTIAEYVVMHLLAFSPVLWPSGKVAPHLQSYYKGSRDLQRIMANIPTYCMFDDHEVTDDWFLDESWRNKVEKTLLGKQIISNALTAFFICQVWGSHKQFDELLPIIKYRLKKPFNEFYQEKLLEQEWTYEIKTSPQTLVLDTHNNRYGFSKKMQIVQSEKIEEAFNRVSKEDKEQLVLVSPAPVFGITALEKAQDVAAYKMGGTKVDHERWFKSAFTNLMRNISKRSFSNVIILSGDFHYAMNIQAKVDRNNRPPLHIYQMVSSATKNRNSISQLLNFVMIIKNLFWFSFKGKSIVKFEWNLRNLRSLKYPFVLNENNVGIVEIVDFVDRGFFTKFKEHLFRLKGNLNTDKKFTVIHTLITKSKSNPEETKTFDVKFETLFWSMNKVYKTLSWLLLLAIITLAVNLVILILKICSLLIL